ncbi:uncharacterized protein LOC126996881 [Eriocheir sinensis]|uniref:uncharacterized protein LOC126996881 n=1 Tax=Eriocheir sinensis TaxID=95602 RepID=UPI0021CA1654|nr:uncharacterized protein LOC126996881 [Eriocheir sinensis]
MWGAAAAVWVAAWACVGGAAARDGRYTWGNALTDPTAAGPDGRPYPSDLINRLYADGEFRGPRNMRRGRTLHHTLDPDTTRARLLSMYQEANSPQKLMPEGRSMADTSPSKNLVSMADAVKTASAATAKDDQGTSAAGEGGSQCPQGPPARLCKTSYNTTAPMYGISLTSGQPVTIVQKFPDLLQQVIFEMCESETCEILQGQCVQTYVPYLFLVIPLGPVTLTGQDYVLVESGCACQPKYSQGPIPSPVDAIPGPP